MNKKANKLVTNFFQSVSAYMKREYKSRYYRFYNDPIVIDEMMRLTSTYYWGGNSIPNTTGDVVDYIKSKYNV
jgi:hypothetical protein